jgi:hypothetical protein
MIWAVMPSATNSKFLRAGAQSNCRVGDGTVDHMRGLSSDEKKQRPACMSYQAFQAQSIARIAYAQRGKPLHTHRICAAW